MTRPGAGEPEQWPPHGDATADPTHAGQPEWNQQPQAWDWPAYQQPAQPAWAPEQPGWQQPPSPWQQPAQPTEQAAWGQPVPPVAQPPQPEWAPNAGWTPQYPAYDQAAQVNWSAQPGRPLQQPGWPPPGQYVEPPRRRRTALLVGLPIGVLVLAAIVVAAVLLTNRDNHHSAAAAASPTSTPSHVPPPPTTQTNGAPVPPATVSGWQVLTDGGAAVDVPPDWAIAPGVAPGGGSDTEAVYGQGACGTPTSFRGRVMQMSDASPDIATGARNIVDSVITAYYGSDRAQLSMGDPKPTADGALTDYKATLTLTPANSCDPPKAIVHVVVARGDKGGTFAIVVLADQQAPGAPAESDLDRIASTVRAAN